jgi:hypothetical protein
MRNRFQISVMRNYEFEVESLDRLVCVTYLTLTYRGSGQSLVRDDCPLELRQKRRRFADVP